MDPEDMSDDELAEELARIDQALKAPLSDGTLPIDQIVQAMAERARLVTRRAAIAVEQQRRAGFPGLAKLASTTAIKLRADELTTSGEDKFRLQTFRVDGPTITVKFPTKANPFTGPKNFTISSPRTRRTT